MDKKQNVVKIPEGLGNLLWVITARNGWKEPLLVGDESCLSATTADDVTVIFQPDDNHFLVQGRSSDGDSTGVRKIERDDYEAVEQILNACHAA